MKIKMNIDQKQALSEGRVATSTTIVDLKEGDLTAEVAAELSAVLDHEFPEDRAAGVWSITRTVWSEDRRDSVKARLTSRAGIEGLLEQLALIRAARASLAAKTTQRVFEAAQLTLRTKATTAAVDQWLTADPSRIVLRGDTWGDSVWRARISSIPAELTGGLALEIDKIPIWAECTRIAAERNEAALNAAKSIKAAADAEKERLKTAWSEALTQAVRKLLPDRVRQHGAGRLDEAVILAAVRNYAFQPLAEVSRYARLTDNDLPCTEECPDSDGSYKTEDHVGPLSVDQFEAFEKIKALAGEGATTQVRLHVGTCDHCEASIGRLSVRVGLDWHGRTLSREYALPEAVEDDLVEDAEK